MVDASRAAVEYLLAVVVGNEKPGAWNALRKVCVYMQAVEHRRRAVVIGIDVRRCPNYFAVAIIPSAVGG